MSILYHTPPFKLKSIKLEITHECPLTCVHCSSEAGPSITRQVSQKKALQIAAEAVDMGVKEVDISGGEPLLWPGLPEVISKLSSGGVQVTVYTCGVIEDFHERALSNKERGLSRMVFSVFGAEAKTHERITRSAGSLEKTVSSVKHALCLGLSPEFHFVPFKANYQHLPELVDMAVEIGVQKISVLRFVPQGRGALLGDMVLDRDQNVHLRQMIEDGRKRIEIRTGSPYNFLLVNESPECCAAIDRLIVGPDLLIYPCDAFKGISAKELVGTEEYSTLADWSLSECWDRSPFLKAIRDYLTTDFPERCRECKLLSRCLSGCLAQKLVAHGDLRKEIDPMCLIS